MIKERMVLNKKQRGEASRTQAEQLTTVYNIMAQARTLVVRTN